MEHSKVRSLIEYRTNAMTSSAQPAKPAYLIIAFCAKTSDADPDGIATRGSFVL